MSALYYCGNSARDTITGNELSLMLRTWESCGYDVKATDTGYAVTFANGYVRNYRSA